MHPAISSSIAAFRSARHHPQIKNLNRHRARIRSIFFVVVLAVIVAGGFFVAQRQLNGVGGSENKSASARVTSSAVSENNTPSSQTAVDRRWETIYFAEINGGTDALHVSGARTAALMTKNVSVHRTGNERKNRKRFAQPRNVAEVANAHSKS